MAPKSLVSAHWCNLHTNWSTVSPIPYKRNVRPLHYIIIQHLYCCFKTCISNLTIYCKINFFQTSTSDLQQHGPFLSIIWYTFFCHKQTEHPLTSKVTDAIPELPIISLTINLIFYFQVSRITKDFSVSLSLFELIVPELYHVTSAAPWGNQCWPVTLHVITKGT